jgi:peptidoglycan hydrolase FlgJ
MNISSITSTSPSPAAAALGALAPTGPAASQAVGSDGATPAQRKKAAAQFEAILVRQMLSQSVGSMLGGEGKTAGSMYGDMLTDVLAQKLTAGQGLGLGKMIETQLTPRAAHGSAPPVQRP